MLPLIQKHWTVLKFILTFLGSYFVLVFVYQLYLDHFHSRSLTDPITELVALQSQALISSLGYEARVSPSAYIAMIDLFVNKVFIAKIIEGCNSISLIILFVAFMLSFAGRLKPTLLFTLAGAVIIYAMNVIRIAILAIGIYERPEHADFFHKIVFPLIIYGTVFLLWILWIFIYNKKNVK